jgi:hypothetical protein
MQVTKAFISRNKNKWNKSLAKQEAKQGIIDMEER